MFESAELGHEVSDADYERDVPKLRKRLLDAQYSLLETKPCRMIVVIAGVEGAGKGETVNLLNEWMDPRHIETRAFDSPSADEQLRPPFWRYWRVLPALGKTGIMFGSWYTEPIVLRANGKISESEFERQLEEIVRFERMLTNEQTKLVKFWFHLSKKAQKKRLKSLEKHRSTRWRVTKDDWEKFARYDQFRRTSEVAIRETSNQDAPWTIVEGVDANYRSLTVGKTLLAALRGRLAKPAKTHTHAAPLVTPIDRKNPISALNLNQAIDDDDYDAELPALQGRLSRIARKSSFQKKAVVVAFEGSDAAGKGGAIRRVTSALDARHYQVIPISAPSEEERAQPYLWRFWKHVPRLGTFAIFDRSWYGRVLVERVEQLCSPDAFMRAYSEINDFEEGLDRAGVVVIKFWLQISKDEQLRRFHEREKTGFKQYKLTKDDWRNRKKWDAYQGAAADMIDRTSTDIAPWHLVEANDKRFARLKVLRTICERLG